MWVRSAGSSPSEELLHELSNAFEDFKPDQFDLVSVDQSASALQMLEDHEAQLAIIWEPDTTAAHFRQTNRSPGPIRFVVHSCFALADLLDGAR